MLNVLFPASFGPSTFDQFSREVDRLLGMSPDHTRPHFGASWPGMNLWREADTIVAEAEVPGMTIDDLEVVASEDSVTIRGERRPLVPDKAAVLRSERPTGRFERTAHLPITIEPDEVKATLTNGVLRVVMPVARTARPRRIAVNAGSEPVSETDATK
jgi:HSP20 family protein